MKYGLWGLLALVAGIAIYVRAVPQDINQWHDAPFPELDRESAQYPGGYIARSKPSDDAMALLTRMDSIIRATPRTRRVAGSLEQGKLTYMTRSLVFGFPDFTTVTVDIDYGLLIYGRLRFGRSDLGVNRARIEGWLAQLDATG